jgi:hypothetical protein
MQQRYFITPFGLDGDLQSIPTAIDPSGYVSYTQGWTYDYERPTDGSDALSKDIIRQTMNSLFCDITTYLQDQQQYCAPEMISSADNGGSAFPYGIGAITRTGSGTSWINWVSLVSGNTVTPVEGSSWSQLATAKQIAVETARAEAAEALKAPIANPAFTGSGSITGDFAAGGAVSCSNLYTTGEVSAGVLSTTVTGYLTVGSSASNIGGSLGVNGALTANAGLTVNNAIIHATDGLTVDNVVLNANYGIQIPNTHNILIGTSYWEEQVPSGGSTVALESNVGVVGGATTYSVGSSYAYLGGGPVPSASGTFTFGLITGYGAAASGFYTNSDTRMKDDQSQITDADGYSFVKSVKPTRWTWNTEADKGKSSTGYIAQQLIVAGYPDLVAAIPTKDVLPEATHVIDGKEITSAENIRLIAKYDETIAYLHAALRGALSRIEALEANREA